MRYSWVTMRHALTEVGNSKGDRFVWESSPGVHKSLTDQFNTVVKHGRGHNFVNDLLEYCLLVYDKAMHATGPQLIGRQPDLWVTARLNEVGLSASNESTLWGSNTQGNIQKMDKWSPVVNDCWMLGGIHRRADYELVSVRTLKNLWDFKNNFHVVTAREILELLNFGYAIKPQADQVKLVCVDPGKANVATIQACNALMKDKERIGADTIRSILVMDPALKSEIEGFDRSRLKHVVPPR